ncbi:ankyrin repeat domain-containing protein 45 isoform X1 [Gasterosteus aculeatus]
MSSFQRAVFESVLSGDLEALQRCLEREAAAESRELDPFGMKDKEGRNALLNACMLGRTAIARELVRHGARVNERTARGEQATWLLRRTSFCSILLNCHFYVFLSSGYTALHLAACWGHLGIVGTLVELGADLQAKTFRGQRPVDLAQTYSRTQCANCLLTAEAKQDLMTYVGFVQDLVSDPESSLTGEEKEFCECACSAKTDWIQTVRNPKAADFTAQRRDMEDTLRPILHKPSAQCTYWHSSIGTVVAQH